MKRIVPFFVFFVLTFLAACSGPGLDTAVTPAITAQPQTVATANAAVSNTSFTPATNVAEAAVLRADDHTHGATDPVVTIIEYGDFQ
ncbi:MAG: hypothetical protein P8183_23615 [Anaerolineae bacterium]|jgi:uncharacterized lipoprotein YajG